MRYLFCFLPVLLLVSFTIVDHEVPVDPRPALRSFQLQKLTLTHSEYGFDRLYSHSLMQYNDKKIKVVYGVAYDSVFMYQQDTLIATFKARNYSVFGELRRYDTKGHLELLEHMEDSIDVNDPRASTFYNVFKVIRHGKSESFFPDGKLGSETWYRHGKNDTFEKIWYTNGNLYAYKHKDTQMYFYEDGKPEVRSYFTTRGKVSLYVKYLYWPNGKVKAETYYEDENGLFPTYIWKDYDEKGRLITRANKNKKEPYAVELLPPASILQLEFPACDLQLVLKDSIRNILKRTDVFTEGLYRIRFSLSERRAELVAVEGPEKYSLTNALKSMFYNLQCYSQPHNGRRGKDFYTLEIYISE